MIVAFLSCAVHLRLPGIRTDMGLTSFPGESYLALSLSESTTIFIGFVIKAVGAGHTAFVDLTRLVLGRYRHPTRMTLIKVAWLKLVINGYSLIEDKTLALP